MAQDNAAQPLLDLRSKLGEYARKFLGDDKPSEKQGVVYAGSKPDTSYHDSMVKAANESFLKADEAKRKVGKKASRKAAKKRTAPLANKRVGRKR